MELGHRRIAYLISSDYDSISRQRLAGYYAALEEAGINRSKAWVRSLKRDPQKENYRSAGERAQTQWLREDWFKLGCTALLAHNDEVANGVIRAFHLSGVSVPEGVSVTGFDGLSASEKSVSDLTTVQVPLQEVGATAVRILARQVQNSAGDRIEKVLLPIRLEAGSSTSYRFEAV